MNEDFVSKLRAEMTDEELNSMADKMLSELEERKARRVTTAWDTLGYGLYECAKVMDSIKLFLPGTNEPIEIKFSDLDTEELGVFRVTAD